MRRFAVVPIGVALLAAGGASPTTRPPMVLAANELDTLDGRLPTLRFESVPFEQAIQEVRNRCHVRIDVDWEALHAIGIERSDPVTARLRDIKVRKALRVIVKPVDGDDEAHKVRVEDAADGRSVLLTSLAVVLKTVTERDYPVGDLVSGRRREQAMELDEIVRYIEQNVDPRSWADAGGTLGTLTVDKVNNVIRVRQSPANHRAIDSVLDSVGATLHSSTRPSSRPSSNVH